MYDTSTYTWYYTHKYKYMVLHAQLQVQGVICTDTRTGSTNMQNMQKYKCMIVQAHIQVQIHGSTGTYTSTWYYMHKIQIHGNTYTKYRYVSMMHHLGIYTQVHGSSCIDPSTCQYMHRHKYIKVWTWSNKKLLRKYNKQLRFARHHKVRSRSQTITGGSCHKQHLCSNKSFVTTNTCLSQQNVFCHDKSMLAVTKLLSWQNYVCCDTIFVMTNTCLSRQKFCLDKHMNTFVTTKLCLSRQIFVVTKVLLWQKYFVMTSIIVFTTKLLSQQAYFCCDKRCVLLRQTRVCCDNFLPWQKWYLWQLGQMITDSGMKYQLLWLPAVFITLSHTFQHWSWTTASNTQSSRVKTQKECYADICSKKHASDIHHSHKM